MRLIVTRPEPEASRTAQALIRLGHQAILSPMLDIEILAGVRLPDRRFQTVLATSSNGVKALAAHAQLASVKGLALLAVGDHTALEAKRAGFGAARSAGGSLGDLVRLVATELRPADGPLLYAAGDVQAGDLAGRLQAQDFDVDTVVLYRARARTRLAGVAADALRAGAADGILLYSQRSAAAFALAVRADGLAPLAAGIACLCLSTASAEPLAAVTSGPILIAEEPNQISLFALVERLVLRSAPSG